MTHINILLYSFYTHIYSEMILEIVSMQPDTLPGNAVGVDGKADKTLVFKDRPAPNLYEDHVLNIIKSFYALYLLQKLLSIFFLLFILQLCISCSD